MALTLFGAAILRIIYLAQTLSIPLYKDFLLLDSEQYKAMAGKIAEGDWVAGTEAYSLAPLYSYFLAVLQSLIGTDNVNIFVAQQGLGLASILLTGLITRSCFNARAGIAAAALLALYGPMALMELKVMASSLAIFLSLASLAVLLVARDKRSLSFSFIAGLVIGFACLARPNTLLFCPLAAFWLMWDGKGWNEAGHRLEWARVPAVVLLTLGVLLAISPATVRNYKLEKELILISSQGGIAFYQANNELSKGTYTKAPGFSGNAASQSGEERKLAEKEAGHELSRTEVSSFWFRKGLTFLTHNPGKAINLMGMKFSSWMGSQELSSEYVIPTERRMTWTLWLMPIPFGILLGLAIAGLRTQGRTQGQGGGRRELLALFIFSNFFSLMIFFVSSRYRLPAVPLLCAFGGAGLVEIMNRYKNPRTQKKLLGWAAPCLVVLLFSLIPWHKGYETQAYNQYYNLGNSYYDRERYGQAADYYRKALEKLDWKWQLHYNLGNTYRRLEDWDRAILQYQRVLEINPKFSRAQQRLEEAKEKAAAE
jgi:4-amino-4-deoxy-L-arabinose transferase-like glycosyltransferase